jgi:hypothetical protein
MWTTPKTWGYKETLASSDLNTHLRDNLLSLRNDAWILNANLSTSAGEIGAGWTSFTPNFTLTGAASQNGTKTGRYKKIGKTVLFEASFTVSGSSNFGGLTSISFTPPTAVNASYISCADVKILDSGTGWFDGGAIWAGSNFVIWVKKSDGTYSNMVDINSLVPMSWAVGDKIIISGFYEEA